MKALYSCALIWCMAGIRAEAFVTPSSLHSTTFDASKTVFRNNQPTTKFGQSLSFGWGAATTIATNMSDRRRSSEFEVLSRPVKEGRPLKIAIAGGGVGGLTAALYMLKQGFDVTIYERTQAFARFGGPIQFASNALSVLRAIDKTLFDRVLDNFTFTGTRVCGIKDGLRADGSFRVTGDSFDYLWNRDAPADWFVKFPLKECADQYGLPYTGVIDRPVLQEILIDECKKIKKDFIKYGAAVRNYENRGEGRGVNIILEDNSQVRADLLVGADGIWSAVRCQMYDEGTPKISTKDGLVRQGCPYSGYTVFAGETVFNKPDYYDVGYCVYIGPQRYFVTSDVGNGRTQWYAFFALPPGTKRAPSGWGGTSRTEQSTENLVDYIKSLHEGWSDEIMEVLERTPPESVEQRDLYDRRPELFRSWADGNVVLIGDAVHAMMPNLGQGGCQAIEDAYVLTNMLSDLKTTEGIEGTLQDFYRERIVRVSIIQFLSKLASDLIINFFDTPWSPHDKLGKTWLSYLTFLWKPALQYIIFPLQFSYLYSFAPTGPMKEAATALEERWKVKHRQDADRVFSSSDKEWERITTPSFFQNSEGQVTVVGPQKNI